MQKHDDGSLTLAPEEVVRLRRVVEKAREYLAGADVEPEDADDYELAVDDVEAVIERLA